MRNSNKVEVMPNGDERNLWIDMKNDWLLRLINRFSKDKGEVSDGYHTFNELYEHRHILFSKLAEWKSKTHSDGTRWDGWFIAGIGTKKGEQITYHIPLRLWDIFRCKELPTAPKWDGHTSNDVLERLKV